MVLKSFFSQREVRVQVPPRAPLARSGFKVLLMSWNARANHVRTTRQIMEKHSQPQQITHGTRMGTEKIRPMSG